MPVFPPGETWRLLTRPQLSELEAYQQLGIKQPLRVKRPGDTYDRTHAWACWKEAQYWEAWAREEGEEISAAAFLHAHPLRAEHADEIPREIRNLKRAWKLGVPEVSEVEFERARAFYARQGMTREEREAWLKRSATGQ